MKKLRILFTLAILAISLTACGESEPPETRYYFKFINETGLEVKIVASNNIIEDELILAPNESYDWVSPVLDNPTPFFSTLQNPE